MDTIASKNGLACAGTTALPKHFSRLARFGHPVTVRGGS
jgi:hypothetical protein